jgi:hypothetical protein
MANSRNQLKGFGTLQQVVDNGGTITGDDYSIDFQSNLIIITELATTKQTVFSIDGLAQTGSDGLSSQLLKFVEPVSEASEEIIIPNESGTMATREWVTKGLVQKTTTEINDIASPTEGEQYYNTTLHTICFYNGTTWQKVTSTNM